MKQHEGEKIMTDFSFWMWTRNDKIGKVWVMCSAAIRIICVSLYCGRIGWDKIFLTVNVVRVQKISWLRKIQSMLDMTPDHAEQCHAISLCTSLINVQTFASKMESYASKCMQSKILPWHWITVALSALADHNNPVSICTRCDMQH